MLQGINKVFPSMMVISRSGRRGLLSCRQQSRQHASLPRYYHKLQECSIKPYGWLVYVLAYVFVYASIMLNNTDAPFWVLPARPLLYIQEFSDSFFVHSQIWLHSSACLTGPIQHNSTRSPPLLALHPVTFSNSGITSRTSNMISIFLKHDP
jgi:hypothetical protein